MFDIGFAELLLIAIIGLVIIGPQRLPETLRTLGLWAGRIRRAGSRLYREVEQEVGMDDIRRQLHNEEVMRNLREIEQANVSRDREATRPHDDSQVNGEDRESPADKS
ncbi:MAG: twin-arginine translocase subunit TatB [Desulfuromonadales bacterium]|nr:twin-arginine translocase subunit TatB [Desulfuromonadales bacterium]